MKNQEKKTEEKFVKYSKTSYTFDPVEYEKYQSKFYPSEYEEGEEYVEEEDEKEIIKENKNKINNINYEGENKEGKNYIEINKVEEENEGEPKSKDKNE